MLSLLLVYVSTHRLRHRNCSGLIEDRTHRFQAATDERLFFVLEERKAEIMSEGPKGTLERPIGIYYEHPDWFRPLFEQMDARGVAWQRIDARTHKPSAGSNGTEYSCQMNFGHW